MARDKTARLVADALHDYDGEFLDCRRGNLGHEWRSVGFYRGAGNVTHRRVVCKRCSTWRTDAWEARTGARLPGRYNYAEGYQLPGVSPDATAVRVEVLRRATVFASEDEMLTAVHTNGGRQRG